MIRDFTLARLPRSPLGARFEATARSIITLLLLTALAGAAEPASASEWWYVAHNAGRVLFVDRQSISREGAVVRYSALMALHDAGGPAGETKSFMLADCRAQTIGWLGMAQYDRKDIQGDVSTRRDADAEMTKPDPATLDDAQLRFVCSARASASNTSFPITIDEIAFADRLITNGAAMTDPRALHDTMAKDPRVPILRSTAPEPRTFGTTQTVRRRTARTAARLLQGSAGTALGRLRRGYRRRHLRRRLRGPSRWRDQVRGQGVFGRRHGPPGKRPDRERADRRDDDHHPRPLHRYRQGDIECGHLSRCNRNNAVAGR